MFLVPKRNPFTPLRLLSRDRNRKSLASIPHPIAKEILSPLIPPLNVNDKKCSIPCRKESIDELCNQLVEYRKVSWD